MKKAWFLIVGILCLVAVGIIPFSNRAVRAVLNEAEIRMEEEPEQALGLLDSIASGQSNWNRALQARFALLYTRAQDKNFIDIVDDSLIVRAVDYYRNCGGCRNRAMAYYYLGVVRHNTGDIAGAMEALVKAQLEAEPCDDSYLQGLIYSELGNAYYEQNTYGEAIEMYSAAIDAFEQCGHKENMFIALNSKGISYYLNRQNSEAIPYLEKALKMAEDMNDIPSILEISAAICQIELDQNPRVISSQNLLTRMNTVYEKYTFGKLPPTHYMMFGKIYLDEGDLDSARYYLLQHLSWNKKHDFAQFGTYAMLATIESLKSNYEEAYFYEKLHFQYCDSVNTAFREHEVRGLELKYKNQELRISYKKLQARHRYERIGVVFLFCLTGVGIWQTSRYLVRKRLQERESYDISIEEYRRYCSDLSAQYDVLEKKCNADDVRLRSLLSRFDKRMKDLKLISEWASLYENNPNTFYAKIKEYFELSEGVNPELVEDVLATANLYCHNIVDYLKYLTPTLSPRELCYCGLVSLGFTHECIRILFNHSNIYSIYTIRNKIRDKLGLKKSSFNLEKHIRDLQNESKIWAEKNVSKCK